MPKINILELQNLYFTAADTALNKVCSKHIIKGGDFQKLMSEARMLAPEYIMLMVEILHQAGVEVEVDTDNNNPNAL